MSSTGELPKDCSPSGHYMEQNYPTETGPSPKSQELIKQVCVKPLGFLAVGYTAVGVRMPDSSLTTASGSLATVC